VGQAAERGLDIAAIAARTDQRLENIEAFRAAALACERTLQAMTAPAVSPARILAVEGRVVLASQPPTWHLVELSRIEGDGICAPIYRAVDLTSAGERANAVDWWLELTAHASDGIVVRPSTLVGQSAHPGLQVRGREQLRLIHGVEDVTRLDHVRRRDIDVARVNAVLQGALAVEALARFVRGDTPESVHEAVSGIVALPASSSTQSASFLVGSPGLPETMP
jgi:hypothetical protein